MQRWKSERASPAAFIYSTYNRKLKKWEVKEFFISVRYRDKLQGNLKFYIKFFPTNYMQTYLCVSIETI